VAILSNFTAHPVVEMCTRRVSPDYPGEMSCELERRHPGSAALFLQGAAGNINPLQVSAGAEHARLLGNRLADLVDKTANNARSGASEVLEVAGSLAHNGNMLRDAVARFEAA
jgi:hypothetical protein